MLTSFKCVLVICAGVVCDLEPRAALARVLEEVDVRVLVKPVVRGLVRRRAVEIMNISEAFRRNQFEARLSYALTWSQSPMALTA